MNRMLILGFVFIVIVAGCENDSVVVSEGLGSLYDPNIQPAVIYHYPAKNSYGSLQEFYSPSYYYQQPHFALQFNKVMAFSGYELTDQEIAVSGFDEPIFVSVYSSSSTTGMYMFEIRQQSNGSLMSYRLGKTYSVTVKSGLKDMHGQSLTNPFTFSFTKDSVFRIVSYSPKDSITSSSSIAINFNSEVSQSIASKISITPSLSGTWYVGGSDRNRLYFYPNTAYQAKTKYTVTVASDAADVSGNKLNNPFSFSFSSSEFRVEYTSPQNNSSSVSLSQYIYVRLNAMISTQNILPHLKIVPSIAGTIDFYSGQYFYFRPTTPYQELTKYTVQVDTTLPSQNGHFLSAPYVFSFTTEGFRSTNFLPSTNSDVSRHSNIEISFNSLVDSSTVKNGIVINPPVVGKYYFADKFKRLTFRPDTAFAPQTVYTVSTNSNLKSQQGNAISNPSTFTFTTE